MQLDAKTLKEVSLKPSVRSALIGLLLISASIASPAATLVGAMLSPGTDSGMKSHPVGRWVSADELDIHFVIWLPEFKDVDAKSMSFELTGGTIVLHYGLAEIPHKPDQPILGCRATRTLTYAINGLEKQSYRVQIVGETPVSAQPLTIVPLNSDGQLSYALKLQILADGSLVLDGKPISKENLEKAFKDDIAYQLPVWFYGQSPKTANKNVPALAQHFLDLAISEQLPFAISSRPDFSDLVSKYKGN